MFRRFSTCAAVVAATFFLASCVGIAPQSPSPEPGLVVSSQTATGMEAVLQGVTVGRLAGGCVGATGPNGEEYVLVFPQGTTLSEERIQLPEGETAHLGDVMNVSGGMVFEPFNHFDLPGICDGLAVWAVGEFL